ncbi:MAG TPA: twin-arginine translocase TatA/TatE family subunit [Solirubrobacteraceae bacterium]|nr:twin-arginine translocase TatA/TatE family subunit [Solirubrobacteraceae bacterium]
MFIKSPSTDLIIVLVIVLLIFGPKRLPGLGKQLGQGMREFKDGITGHSKDEEDESRPELTAASAPSASHSGSSERQSAEVGSQPRA